MDYLIIEGYPSAAKRFAMEANIQPKEDVASIRERVSIRNAIHRGDIQEAIEMINDLGYQVSRCHRYLLFSSNSKRHILPQCFAMISSIVHAPLLDLSRCC